MAKSRAGLNTGTEAAVSKILGSARDIHGKIVSGRKPSMRFPLRSLSNVRYTGKGHFEMAGKKKERFVDCDPYGIGNIYRTLKVGSGNNAHLNEFFCVPQARYLGVTPQDITDYRLPTHPLKEIDVKRAKDALKNDPFFQHYKEWARALEQLLKMGVRAEQQAFAKHDLNYVMDTYLPAKLKHPEKFLP